ncbi:MAG: PAS domain S-box protein [Syntrophomonadaceae bacterium]
MINAHNNEPPRPSCEFYFGILMSSPHPFSICTKDRIYIDVNDAWLQTTGYQRYEVLGRHMDEINIGNRMVIKKQDPQKAQLHMHTYLKPSLKFEVWIAVINSRVIQWVSYIQKDGATEYIVSRGVDITRQLEMENSLQEKNAELSSIFAYANSLIFTANSRGTIHFVSPGCQKMLGYNASEIEGKNLKPFLHPDDIIPCKAVFKGMIKDEEPVNIEYRIRHRDGSWRWHLCSGGVAKNPAGKVLFYIGIATDVTEKKQVEQALLKSEDKFSKAFHSSPTPMSISTLEEGCFIDVNETFCQVVGYERQEMLGRTSFDLQMWTEPVKRSEVKEKLLRGKTVRNFEVCFRMKSGEKRLGLYAAESINIDGQICMLSILIDITDQRLAEEEVRYLSFHDRLTGLYNRAFFEEELTRLDTARQMPLSIIMGDVNGLKLINDALGHQEGDKLLIMVAVALKEACRSEDIVARWGGDEFIILLPGCPHNVAAGIVERIKGAETIFHTLPIQTSISLGTATKTLINENIRSIIKEAEDKMYRNKLLENKSTRSYFLSSLERTLWSRSHETKDHCERIKKMAMQIGEHIHLPAGEMDSLRLLAALHDIGKIAISNSILEKPGKLTAEEWETIKKHPEVGYRIALSSPEMAPIAEAILHHHERWDGAGYPLGLMGKDIPFLSRIISIVDAYDVMTHGRPYQAAVSSEDAWSEIIRMAGSQFDPDLVNIISNLNFESDWK